MTFDELKEMIKKDISLDETQLDRESVRTPQIHNKYLIFFMEEKLSLTRMSTELDSLKTKKWLYYSGRMSADELKEMLERAASNGDEISFEDFYFIMTKKTFA